MQRELIESRHGQDAADSIELKSLARVRRAHQREQLAVKIETGAQHADRLQRFVGTAWIHRSKVSTDRGRQAAVRIGNGYPAAMNTLDEAVADDLNQHRVGFKRADHDLTICLTAIRAAHVCVRRTDICLNGLRGRLQRPSLSRVDWRDYDAALFDLDGVLTPTAEVHMRAWRRLFSDFLIKRGIDQPYLESDYFSYIDGKPRYDGVRAFLASRGIQVAEGDPNDSPTAETVCGLGNRKNEFFGEVLREEGVQPYPGSVQLLDHLLERGTKVAVVTSSKNATAVLEAADLRPRFGVIVDGNVAAEKGLRGKPSPDTFVAAAEQLGVNVERAVVFEDAVSGVQAGHAGGFGLVVGVDRGVGAQRLTESGADVVINDLAELAA